ncbi:hypothetical protein DRQ50_00910 [bacterium]|nr:MAG: hypothetical protein DRQ50_00910 [bacterium]
MRRIIILAAVLVLLPVVAAAADSDQGKVVEPSHPREHARDTPHAEEWAKSACAQCHACPEPTPADPCLVHCPRHGAHFYGEHGADEGPDVVIIDQLANLFQPVVFAHKLHAGMSKMGGGCTLCHHYSETTGEIPPCRSCHEVKREEADLRMPALKGAYHRQCMNCHRDWSHENACGFCHDENVDGTPGDAAHDPTDIVGVPHPKIEATATYNYETSYEDGPIVTFHHTDHVELFGQQCVDCHRGDSCASCHDTEQQPTDQLNHLTTCCTCHTERDCMFCHATEPKPPFEHGRSTGWNLSTYHSDLACVACHDDPSSFRTPQTRCTSCHIHWEVGSFDHSVTSVILDDDHVDLDCDSCHLDMEFGVAPVCDDCHDEHMFPERIPGRRKLH